MTGARLPVVVVGGFLGAGKTSLLNRAVARADGLRVGVIVNDFGSIGFDEELAGAVSSHQRLLANGCVCCSIRNDLLETMAELVAMRPPLDVVLVEASGAADPLSLVTSLSSVALSGHVRVSAVVTVADATQVREQEEDYGGELILRQLRAATTVVLNKCDLVEAAELAATRAWLGELGVDADVVEAVRGDVPIPLMAAGRVASVAEPEPGLAAHDRFDEWTLETAAEYSADAVRTAFDRLPAGVVRAKGVVALPDDGGHLLVQYAAGRLELVATGEQASAAGSRLVVISARGSVSPSALEALFAV